jgi:hypothetical protein
LPLTTCWKIDFLALQFMLGKKSLASGRFIITLDIRWTEARLR